jgi:F-box domain
MSSWLQIALKGHLNDIEKKKRTLSEEQPGGVLRLPPDVILYIAKNLEDYDIVSLALVNKNMFKIMHNELCRIRYKCMIDIQICWKLVSNDAINIARKNNFILNDPSKGYDHQDERNCLSKCLCFRNKSHYLKVIYVHKPHDVDILDWYEDYVKYNPSSKGKIHKYTVKK